MVDFKRFCNPDKLSLRRQWSHGEWTYASNGHMGIAVPRLPEIDENPCAPNLEEILAALDFSSCQPFSVNLPPKKKGKVMRCRSCDGLEKEHDCPDCQCICEHCKGKGTTKAYDKKIISIGIGSAIFRLSYIRILQSLHGFKFPLSPDRYRASPFLFDGGRGCIMPVSSPYPDHIVAADLPNVAVSE